MIKTVSDLRRTLETFPDDMPIDPSGFIIDNGRTRNAVLTIRTYDPRADDLDHDETKYLLRDPVNRQRMYDAMAQIRAGQTIDRDIIEDDEDHDRQDHDFERMIAGEDGWCDWVHPLPGYRMSCCDCGLIHEMEYVIQPSDHETVFNEGEDKDHIVIFRARRWPRPDYEGHDLPDDGA